MELETIVGHMLSGLACRIYAAIGAIAVAHETVLALKPLATVASTLGGIAS